MIWRIKYRNGVKRITLFRNLLAKLVYRGLGIDETLVLYDLYGNLVDECEQKVDFARKYEAWLITCFALLNDKNPQTFPFRLQGHEELAYRDLLQPYLPSERAFLSWTGNPINHDPFRVIADFQLTVKKPSSYRLGKGYTDKGSAKRPEKDGSPGWKEVATKSKEPVPSVKNFDTHVRHRDISARKLAAANLKKMLRV